MRTIPSAVATALKTQNLIGDIRMLYRVTVTKADKLTTQVLSDITSITIDRSIDAMAAEFTISINNKGGKWTPSGQTYPQVLVENNRIQIEVGYSADGMVNMLIGYIDSVSVQNDGTPTIEIKGRDMLKLAIDQTFIEPNGGSPLFSQMYNDYDYSQLIAYFLTNADLTASAVDSGIIEHMLQCGDGTFADVCKKLADKIGYWIYCTEDGIVRIEPFTNTSASVYYYQEGVDLLGISQETSDADVYSQIIIYNSKTGTSHSAAVGICNVPTMKVKVVENNDLTSEAEMSAVASNMIEEMRSKYKVTSAKVVPNPYLQLGDIITVRETTTNIYNNYRISSYSLSMTPGSTDMTLGLYDQ